MTEHQVCGWIVLFVCVLSLGFQYAFYCIGKARGIEFGWTEAQKLYGRPSVIFKTTKPE